MSIYPDTEAAMQGMVRAMADFGEVAGRALSGLVEDFGRAAIDMKRILDEIDPDWQRKIEALRALEHTDPLAYQLRLLELRTEWGMR